MVGSHYRLDQLDRPDRPNFPTNCSTRLSPPRALLDRTRPLHDLSWLLHDFNQKTTPISTRSTPYMISIRSRPDQIDLVVQGSWGIGQIEVELIGYWSVNFFIPTKLDLYRIVKKRFPINLTSSQPIPDHFLMASQALGFSIFTRIFWTCPKFSGRKPER